MRIAVDTGGTFTDCVVLEGSQLKILKVFTTPADSAQGIVEGVRRLAGDSPLVAPIDIIHGTTVGTNSLLERRGARVALVTTAGFEDLLEIGRQNRPRLYDLNVHREPPLVPQPFRWGVRERTAASGEILLRPRLADIRRLLRAIDRSAAESIALCFLFSFRNAANERLVTHALGKLGLPVSVSHEILPEFREYERLSTVVINAYLAPLLGTYLARLAAKVRHSFAGVSSAVNQNAKLNSRPAHTGSPRRLPGRIYVMQSSGGITSVERAAREPVRTILSGPAGGVVAAALLAKKVGIARALSFDMGGTSTDVCLLDGPPRTTRETTLAGLPVAVPVLDVHSVGAGGGSLARVDAGGALRVGPDSAGAEPGPICYGRGGTRPTVTDAHLLLGRLDPDYFLGGAFPLDSQAVERYCFEFLHSLPSKLRGSIPKSPHALARGIVAVSNAIMERAMRLISVERGHDPRDFTLICFGGAGGLHAADLARSLGLAGVIIPIHPGAFSALGILLSDIVRDVSQSVLLTVPKAEIAGNRRTSLNPKFRNFMKKLQHRFESMERSGCEELRREHFKLDQVRVKRRLALRYTGQAYELSVPFTQNSLDHFHSEHERAYGYARQSQAVELVSLQMRLTIPTPKQSGRSRISGTARALRCAQVKRRPVWFNGRVFQTAIYDRGRLYPGMHFGGPAIIVEYSSTTVVPPDFACEVDKHMNLRLAHHAR